MSQWQSLGTIFVGFAGHFSPLELGGQGGKISFRIAPFPAHAQGTYTIGVYSGVKGAEGYVGSVVRPLTDYERFETFEIPPQLPKPLFGIRLNQDASALTTEVDWILCEDCGGGEAAQGGVIDLAGLIPPPRFCQAITAPEIDRPTTLKRVGNEYWVFNFLKPALRLGLDFAPLGVFGPAIERPRPNNAGVDRIWDVLIDEANDRIFYCCFSRHVVRAFRLSTITTSPEHLADIPRPSDGATSWASNSSSRPFEAGYLRTVTGAALLPNGNLAIASRQGVGGSSPNSLGAILEYSPDGDYVQTLVSVIDGGGLLQDGNYRDWFGKLRWIGDRLWAISFRQKMAVRFGLTLEAGAITAVFEDYRQFLKPSGLPVSAAWTPHSLAVVGDELLSTHNAAQGQTIGIARGLYSTSLSTGGTAWTLGILDNAGSLAFGDHPANFNNPHDFINVGTVEGKECFLIADFELSRVALLPKPEFYADGMAFVEIAISPALAPGEDLEKDGISFNSATNKLRFPIPRLPIYT